MDAVLPRKDTPPEYAWNAESVFRSREEWDSEFQSLSRGLFDLESLQGRLKDGPLALLEALERIEDFKGRVAKVYLYAGLSHKVDATDQAAAEMFGRAQALDGRMKGAAAFWEPELLETGEETLREWIGKEPRLAVYEHYIRDLFRRSVHIRSKEVEELLGELSDPFSGTGTTAGFLTNADLEFAPAKSSDGSEIAVAQGTIEKILSSGDPEARRTAWEHYADRHLAFKNTLASNLVTAMKQNIFLARARRHASSLEAALFQNNIPVELFHGLIEAFRRNLHVWRRYWAIRRKALEVAILHPYDIWAPLGKAPPKVPFAQAVDWICEALAPLGYEYVQVLRRGCLEERWVDVYPNQGKTSGAFSWGTQGTHPFVVMSYTDDVPSLSTLAHELGHSMHSYLSWKTQPHIYSEYAIFAAEVASNFHQAMVRAHLLHKTGDSALEVSLIEEAMSNFHRYLFIMPTLARFELETHKRIEEGRGVTADDMIGLTADLFSEGYGDLLEVDRERVGIAWAAFGHLYSDYYVFQYMTGISGAHALANRVLSGKEGAVDDYLRFLKAGGSLYPLEALKTAGVDLASTDAAEETFQLIGGMLDKLEQLTSEAS